MGRPSDYDDKLAESICLEISVSVKGLDALCEENNWPEARTIYRWLLQNEDFSQKYARARELQSQLLADELIVLADADKTQVDRSRLQIDTRKWLLSKLQPKKYGDRVAQEVSGPDGGPIPVSVVCDL